MERYRSYSTFLKEFFGKKLYKICLDGGCTCPNRDGSLGTGGCIFCSTGGSGEFSEDASLSVTDQLKRGRSQSARKYDGDCFIAYFQAFTGTYTDPDRLRSMLSQAMSPDWILAVAIGTRPDCLPEPILDVLSEMNRVKPIFLEMGLQTSNDRTARSINRCYPTATFTRAVHALHERGIRVCAHIILGLPGETGSREDLQYQTIRYLNTLPVSGIKISMLNVLKGTRLGEDYLKDPFPIYSMEEYIRVLVNCIEELREDIVIERMTGDGPKDLLIAPRWICDKRRVLGGIQKELKERGSRQGIRSEKNDRTFSDFI